MPRIAPRLAALFLIAAVALIALACSSDAEEPDSPTAAPVAKSESPAPTATTQPVQQPTQAPASTPAPTQPPPTAIPVPEPPTPEPQFPLAPELTNTGGWINSEPFTLADMRDEGNVVLIDFWTYTCINCIRTLPYLREWHDKYADNGLVILGVHTPEFNFEKEYDNVVEAVAEFELEYAVVQDNDFGTWRAFENRYWPAKYLIDHNGHIRYYHFGEGAYEETEQIIREILTEAGHDVSAVSSKTTPEPAIHEEAMGDSIEEGQTRELYAGYERNVGALMSLMTPPYVMHEEYYTEHPNMEILYEDPGDRRNHFLYLNGLWRNGEESIIHARATQDYEDYIALKFFGTSANVVMSPPESAEPYNVRVLLDESPVPQAHAGKDIMYDDDGNSYVSVDESRMYFLVDMDAFGSGELRLTSNSPEFRVFAFTFGSYMGGDPAKDS